MILNPILERHAPAPAGGRRRNAVLVAALAAYLACYAGSLAFPAASWWFSHVFYFAVPAAVMVVAVGAVRSSRGRERVGVACVAACVVCWVAGDALFSWWYIPQFDRLPGRNLADPLYYAGYISLIAAIPLLGVRRRGLFTWRSVLDAGIIIAVAGAVAWRFVLADTVRATDSTRFEIAVAAGYPLLDLGLLIAVVFTVYQRAWTSISPRFAFLAGAALVQFAADMAYLSWLLRSEQVPDPSVIDLGWLLGFGLLGAALLAPGDSAARPRQSTRTNIASSVLPYVVLLPLVVVAFAESLIGHPSGAMLVGSGVAILCVLARQWLTLLENLRLRRAIEVEHMRAVTALDRQRRLVRELELRAAELEALRAEAQHLADYDSLTGLLNRGAWMRFGEGASPASVCVFDIDRFKEINDRYGHPAGDAVLREVGARLREELPGALAVGRLGGEEFGALFAVPAAEAAGLCERFAASVRRRTVGVPGGPEVMVSLSAGLADCGPGGGMEAAYREADEMLYLAKQSGRSQVRVAARAA
jgi:diguanylate cyclase (GGDEF)-like protein